MAVNDLGQLKTEHVFAFLVRKGALFCTAGWPFPSSLISHWSSKVRLLSLGFPVALRVAMLSMMMNDIRLICCSNIQVPVYVKHSIVYREGSSGRLDISIGHKNTSGKTVTKNLKSSHMWILDMFYSNHCLY